MVRKVLVALAALTMSFLGGSALASPPETDPTCDNPGGPASGQECAGDNGSPGCDGINIADGHTPDQAEPAMDLVTDILSIGDEGECEDEERSDPGRR